MPALTQSHPASWWVYFGVGAVAGSLMVGALLGLIPLVLGRHLGHAKLGRIAFLVSVLSGFVAGIFGALPVALGFTGTIFLKWRRNRGAIDPGASES